MSTGRLQPVDGRWQIVFAPRLEHSPERVWTALTDPDWLRTWFPNEIHGERREGARLRFTFSGRGGEGAFDGQMRTWNPPHTLAFRWGEDELRFDLSGDGGNGTLLTFSDTIDDVSRAPREAAGWHECLDRLRVALDGEDPDLVPRERREELHPVYVSEFRPHLATTTPSAPSRRNVLDGVDGPEPLMTESLHEESGAGTAWSEARSRLVASKAYWLATVQPDGRPHVMPLPGIWMNGSLYVSASHSSQAAANLLHDSRCVVTVSSPEPTGLDLVLEGDASTVTDEAELQHLARTQQAKYDRPVTVQDRAFHGDSAPAAGPPPRAVFAVTPTTVLGFPAAAGTDESYGHQQGPFRSTRWRFTQ